MYPREPSQHEVGELNEEQDVDMTLDDGMEGTETAFSDTDESTDRFFDNFMKRQFPPFDRRVIMILYQEKAYVLFRVGFAYSDFNSVGYYCHSSQINRSDARIMTYRDSVTISVIQAALWFPALYSFISFSCSSSSRSHCSMA